jgi:PTH1 family peptidyl-tRNA hydrolase
MMIVGLGNPGETYRQTRHNVGFMVLDRISQDHSIPLKYRRRDNHCGFGTIADHAVVLVAPQAFMNRSGPPILHLLSDYGISS